MSTAQQLHLQSGNSPARLLIHLPALWYSCDVSVDSYGHFLYVRGLLALLLAQIWLNFKQEILKTAVCSCGVRS